MKQRILMYSKVCFIVKVNIAVEVHTHYVFTNKLCIDKSAFPSIVQP